MSVIQMKLLIILGMMATGYLIKKLCGYVMNRFFKKPADIDSIKATMALLTLTLPGEIEALTKVRTELSEELAKDPLLERLMQTQISLDQKCLDALDDFWVFLEEGDESASFEHPEFAEGVDYEQMKLLKSIETLNIMEAYLKRCEQLEEICDTNKLDKVNGEGLAEKLFQMSESRIPYLQSILDPLMVEPA